MHLYQLPVAYTSLYNFWDCFKVGIEEAESHEMVVYIV